METQKKKITLKVVKEGKEIKGNHTPNGCQMGQYVGSRLSETEENLRTTAPKGKLQTN